MIWHRPGALGATLLLLLPLLSASVAEAQSRTLQGRITTGRFDAPWGGALIQVEGSGEAVCAAPDGSFSIDVPRTGAVLSVLPIGYAPRSFDLPPSTDRVFLDLETGVVVLDEIRVRVSGGTRPGGATEGARVAGEELARVPGATIEQGLQARVAGAEIAANSGAPGGGMRVTLRGLKTILGNTSPLYVVDGVVVSNASIPSGRHALTSPASNPAFAGAQDDVPNRISDLNPHDIARVEVLKGAAATALYGSKGSNGVVKITTKRGAVAAPPRGVPDGRAFSCLLPPD